MASFTFRDRTVPVSAVQGISESDTHLVLSSPKFQEWRKRVEDDADFDITALEIQSVDAFGPKLGFAKFKLTSTARQKTCPGIVFMRGGAPAVLVVLERDSDAKLFTVVVEQPRIAIGASAFREIPAGMLDDDGNLAGAAAKELREETGITINQKTLIDMTALAYGESGRAHQGVYSSCGGSDEFNPIFLHRARVPVGFLTALEGRLTGNASENEHIVVRVIPLDELWTTSADSKALAALCLFDRLRACGRLP